MVAHYDASSLISFLSTPSARRATDKLLCAADEPGYFYPRPPRGGRHFIISPIFSFRRFLSTPSARRATAPLWKLPATVAGISIHALREEGDALPQQRKKPPPDFYPRPPRGGRPCPADRAPDICVFLSTPSARRATCKQSAALNPRINFYPRPPRGGRQLDTISNNSRARFLSTPSARRATCCVDIQVAHRLISIHALREEGDVSPHIM